MKDEGSLSKIGIEYITLPFAADSVKCREGGRVSEIRNVKLPVCVNG